MSKVKIYHKCPECGGVDILVYEKTAWTLVLVRRP